MSVMLVATACSGKREAAKRETGEHGPTRPAARSPRRPTTQARKLPPNHNGRIPVLEYHIIGRDKNALYTRTAASFRADLEDVYKRGYRPITIAQMLDKDFSDVPDGMSPVVFVFDDASPEQFRYVEQNGQLQIDPTSGIGIWLDFAKTPPGLEEPRDVLHAQRRRRRATTSSATPRSSRARRKSGAFRK